MDRFPNRHGTMTEPVPGDPGRSGGMADATVSNTVEGNLVWVRIPPSVPPVDDAGRS